MINFPVFEEIAVEGYALYGDGSHTSGLRQKLGKGPWVILGVNGIGKSTLLLLLRSLVLGNTRVAPPGFLGTRDTDVLSGDPKLFALRVSDEAKDAYGAVSVRFGRRQINVRRKLRDLSLVKFEVTGDVEKSGDNEESYRAIVCDLVGISDYANVIRVLDRCVFCLEHRSELVWNVAAQYEIFRALFVTSDIAEKLRGREGELISADSTARNLNATLAGIVNRRNRELTKQSTALNVKVKISELTARLEAGTSRLAEVQEQIDKSAELTLDKRTELLRVEQEVEELSGAYEKLKFDSFRHALSALSTNEQYTLLKIISEEVCPACGNQAQATATELRRRLEEGACLICGSPQAKNENVVPISAQVRKRAGDAYSRLEVAKARLKVVSEQLDKVQDERRLLERTHYDLFAETERLAVSLRRLSKQLPAEDRASMERGQEQIRLLRDEVNRFRDLRKVAEKQLAKLLANLTEAVHSKRTQIEKRFNRYASKFFGDRVRLVYSPRKQRVGQYGELLDFPAFEIEMIGATTDGKFARREGDQVSLSQNYYLDLSFRMAVIETISAQGGAIILDGPETSVDAVFASLAGNLLADYSQSTSKSHNQIIAACNVVEGAFLPSFLSAYKGTRKRLERTINLLDISPPTPALLGQKRRYNRAIKQIFSSSRR